VTVDDGISNPSTNRPFEDVLAARISRRTVMAGGLATAAVAFFGPSAVAHAGRGGQPGPNFPRPGKRPLIGFAPVLNAAAPEGKPVPTISDDYEYDILIPWGSPLQPGGPDIAGGRPASEAEALQQIGIGHDGMWFFPLDRRGDRGILCINHEFGGNAHVLGDGAPAATLEAARISQAVHGVSVVEIRKRRGTWEAVGSRRNRRITPNTPVVFDGPVAGSALLATPSGNPAAGTVNNCANGYTPWGTYLTCEENFNGYFGWNDAAYAPTAEQARYGFGSGGFGYGWHLHEGRWDLSNPDFTNEEHRFGWVVEIDPMRPDAPPVKHTALGRVKHEGIATTVGRGGRLVGYMGDDERFDYIYKFVSSGNWRSMRARGINPLSDGTLYVARFDDDGTGEWLELSPRNPALSGWSMERILVFTRLAADAVGATPMDRPEWTTVAPNGDVYCTLTNNSRRTVADAANPLAPNPNGHIIRWRDADRHVGTTFEWDIFVLAEPDTFGTDHSFGSPDGIWADPDGRIFIETDGGQPDTNNQLLVADPSTGEIRRLLAGVAGDEITGITVSPDRRTLFVNTQHPGDGDPAASNFPVELDPADPDGPVPRDCTFVIRRKDGGIVGS
jgi:secreted PhoX family phosphatase